VLVSYDDDLDRKGVGSRCVLALKKSRRRPMGPGFVAADGVLLFVVLVARRFKFFGASGFFLCNSNDFSFDCALGQGRALPLSSLLMRFLAFARR